MADLWRDFSIRETGTGQQVAQLHDIYDDDDEKFHWHHPESNRDFPAYSAVPQPTAPSRAPTDVDKFTNYFVITVLPRLHVAIDRKHAVIS